MESRIMAENMCRTRSLLSFYSVLVFFALPIAAAAQRGVLLPPETAPTRDRLALVIGNGDYSTSSLRNPTNDARAMARRLGGGSLGSSLGPNSASRRAV